MVLLSPLNRIAIRTAIQHKVRLALTVVAVVVGTAFIAGSMLLTQSLRESFDTIVDTGVEGIDVGVVGSQLSPRGVPLSVVEQMERRSDVSAVNIIGDGPGAPSGTKRIGQSTLVITGADGRPLRTGSSGAHPFAWYGDDTVGPIPTIVEGQPPQEPNQIMLNKKAAARGDLSVGSPVTIVTSAGKIEASVSGIYSSPKDTTGWIGVYFTPERYLELFTDGLYAPQVALRAQGVSPMELRNRLGLQYPLLTPLSQEQIADRMGSEQATQLEFMTYLLAAFGFIALLVGAVIISNTFTMVLRQRRREFALLRSIGISSGQISRSVLVEAVLVGAAGSLVGIVAAVGVVSALSSTMAFFGDDLSAFSFHVTKQALLVPMAVGVAVTVLAAIEPSIRIGRTAPVDGLRGTESPADSRSRVRPLLGVAAVCFGIAATVVGAWATAAEGRELTTGYRLGIVGGGAVAFVVGLGLLGPSITRGASPVVGWLFLPHLPPSWAAWLSRRRQERKPAGGRHRVAPRGQRPMARARRAVVQLATNNNARNSRRTAATSLALALGVALVACVSTLGATTRASIAGVVDTSVKAPLVLDSLGSSGLAGSTSAFSIPSEAIADVDRLPQVTGTGTLMYAPLQVNNWNNATTTVVSTNLSPFIDMGIKKGSSHFKGRPGAMVSTTYAKETGLQVGDYIPLRPMDGQPGSGIVVPVVGIYSETNLFGHIVVNSAAASRVLPDPQAYTRKTTYIDLSDAALADLRGTRGVIEDAVSSFLVVEVKTKQEYRGALGTQMNQMLYIVYALLALAVLIALMGITNTLLLSLSERTRELGMLRAVGLHQRQIRRMVHMEAVQMSILGVALGLGIGLFTGWAAVSVLQSRGLGEMTIPWLQIGVLVVGAIVTGEFAAWIPARRAAKTPPLEAISHDG